MSIDAGWLLALCCLLLLGAAFVLAWWDDLTGERCPICRERTRCLRVHIDVNHAADPVPVQGVARTPGTLRAGDRITVRTRRRIRWRGTLEEPRR